MFSSIFILFLCPLLIFSSDQWHSKSKCTQKEFANYMDISCNSNEFILIGWSHYGTKKAGRNHSLFKQEKCQPSASDCIMDYTHKIAELCNGVSKCEVILTQQFIHKCSDEATYLFISYQCIDNSSIVDVCSQYSTSSSNGLHLISPSFPNEYPNNVNCTCSIEPTTKLNAQSSAVMIDVESLSFNLQDNDHLSSLRSIPLSGTLPFGVSLLTERNSLRLTFTTDETLSQSGFWIRLHGYDQCHDDEYTLGSKCLKVFTRKQTWHLAEEKCLSIGSQLIHIDDIVQERKLTHFLSNINDQHQTSFWISNDHKKSNIQSWWPWRSSAEEGHCVLRTQDGWLRRSCNELQSFICERDIHRQSIPLTVRCGNAPTIAFPIKTITTTLSTTITTTTTTTTPMTTSKSTATTTTTSSTTTSTITTASQGLSSPTVPIVQPPSVPKYVSSSDVEQDLFDLPPLPSYEPILPSTHPEEKTVKSSSFDPNILAAILGGIAIGIFSVNILVCYLCRRRSHKQSKCKTPIESQSSFTHEELQRSLMHHLYHEQTNTISSTSTSSSKHSQSKSNDTSTTLTGTGATPANNSNLLQLCSPATASSSSPYLSRSNAALCFRNPHAGLMNNSDTIDYHFYETIPSEGASYSVCTTHSAFKPILQSNSHTFRPFHPRTNILYHPPNSSKQSYDTTSTSSTSAVLMPVCCHHHQPCLSQYSAGTLRQHTTPHTQIIPPPPTLPKEQVSVGSESIV